MIRIFACIAGEHSHALVALAAFICLLTAFTSASLFHQAVMQPALWARWTALNAFVSGAGIWAIHFLAMLAFDAHLPIRYDVLLTLASIVLAIGVCGAGWGIAAQEERLARPLGGAVVGAGICAMHYVGMAAMKVPGRMALDGGFLLLSLAFGIGFGVAAVVAQRHDEGRIPWRCALLLTLAICGLHFIGMTALSIVPDARETVMTGTIGPQGLTPVVAAIALVIVIISLGVVILERRLARRAVDEVRNMRTLADAAVEGLLVLDGTKVVEANRAFLRLAGYVGDNIPPCTLLSLFPDLDVSQLALGPAAARVETRLANAIGSDRQVELAMGMISWSGKDHCALAVRDVTERNEAAEQISRLAYQDVLTGLPNLASLGDHLKKTIETALAGGKSVALLNVGLDAFRAVNDVHGRPTGDQLLIKVAQRLKVLVGERDLVARLGGDQFIIVHACDDEATPRALADRIMKSMSKPFRVDHKLLPVEVSIGITLCPRDGDNDASLLKNSEIALHKAKDSGRNTTQFYDPSIEQAMRDRYNLSASLVIAINKKQMRVDFQPIADVNTGKLLGFEALARWTHPKRGAISPSDFIPIAEEIGFIGKLGHWVLREAIVQAMDWPPALTLSVNVSAGQFVQGDFAADVERLLAETGFDPERLELEVTESLLIRDNESAIAILTRLKKCGVKIAMDDFGTGYSSLTYFSIFPFDRIKIDQSFVSNITTSPQSRAIVRAVITLSHRLGITVVAEGVETLEQLHTLQDKGCDAFQGFLIGKPMPMKQFDRSTLTAAFKIVSLRKAAA